MIPETRCMEKVNNPSPPASPSPPQELRHWEANRESWGEKLSSEAQYMSIFPEQKEKRKARAISETEK